MTLTKIASTGVEDSLRWVVGANGTAHYTFTGPGLTGTVNDPTIYLTRGHTYIFQNNSGGHPFYIKTSIANGGTNDAYNTGVTNNGGGNGTEIVFTVPHDSPDILYYQCSSHAAMAGQFNIAGSVADGSISTAKIADDAVNNDKLANSVVASIAANTAKTSNATHTGDVTGSTSLTIANDAVTGPKIQNGAVSLNKLASDSVGTAKIIDQAVTLAKLPHGTSSNDGKFLRANNGADPTFETVTGTTINNNANNKVITGSGTANTLNGESNLTFNGQKLNIVANDGGTDVNFAVRNTNSGGYGAYISGGSSSNYILRLDDYQQNAMFRFNGNGNLGVSTGSPSARVHVNTSHYVPTSSGKSVTGIHLDGNPGNAGEYGGGISFACGNSGSAAIAARQGTSDSDVVGISFFTHDSSDGSANAVEKVRIHDGGAVSFNNGIILGNGLGYDSNNLMDDYEEGSWTPRVQGLQITDGSNPTNQGRYVKIGRLIHVVFYIDIGSKSYESGYSSTSQLVISGLPYANGHGGAGYSGLDIGNLRYLDAGNNAQYRQIAFNIGSTQSQYTGRWIQFGNNNFVNATLGDLYSNFAIHASGTYQTA